MDRKRKPINARPLAGFSLLEVMAAMSILLIVSGTVVSAMLQMTKVEGSVTNQTEMHSSVRNATELLAQEVGQAGRVAVPQPITLAGNVLAPAGAAAPATVAVSSATSLFVGEKIVVDTGGNRETVTLTAVNPGANTITAAFNLAHATTVPVLVAGSFVSGIVPPSFASGSTATKLKLYGDINGDGILRYVEYTCDAATGNFYRNVVPLTAGAKPPLDPSMILINNILPNPGGTPCFSYQEKVVQNSPINAVVNVGITLTVQTQYPDPQSHQFVKESKALLNVAPRNIFYGWQMGNAGLTDHMQPMPLSVLALL
jgi:prepilin-type N-terminal cleavage/methylation domain-containing protein